MYTVPMGPSSEHGRTELADQAEMMNDHDSRGKLLAIFPRLPADPSKNSQILVLKNLADHGWQSVVLTVVGAVQGCDSIDPSAVQFVRLDPQNWRWQTAQRFLRIRKKNRRGLARRFLSNLLMPVSASLGFPDAYAATRREIVDLALALHEQSPFDAVLSLYNPLTAHLAAREVASKAGIPWVALSKDFYSWPDHLLSSGYARVINRLKRSYEPTTLRGASVLLTVSDYINDYLSEFMADVQMATLAHCFDDADFCEVEHTPSAEGIFRLVYLGAVSTREGFDDDVKVEWLFEALKDMKSEGIDLRGLRVRFIGSGGDLVSRLARQHGCSSNLEIAPWGPHADAMRELCRATCLLYIQTPFGTRRRLAEYVGSRRPILAYPDYPGTYSSQLISDYGAGRIAADKDSLKAHLCKLYRLFQANGHLDLPVNDHVVNGQSASCRAGEFAEILDRIVKVNSRRCAK